MAKDIWLNLPIQDSERSMKFYKRIGFSVNERHESQGGSLSFVVGDNQIVLMLFPIPVFQSFVGRKVSDTFQGNEVLFSLGADSREEVDEYALKAVQAGGIVISKPSEKDGWLYGCGFADPDGHQWNALYMDLSKLQR